MNKVPSSSPDLTQENIARLKELFPEILTDGEKIDFVKLKTVLGEEVEGEKERYSFNWHGKKAAILGAQKPSKGTLRPDKEKSKNFDTTENLYIEGDNLEVLKLLQKSYSNKIKMIYIDPPYNTGKDFVYKDNFSTGIDNYLEQTGQVDSDGNVLSTNSESNGRYHTDWLNMIYPRLKLARNLLSDDGVIFISIDDVESSRLRLVCDEIFGEKNLVTIFPRITKKGGKSSLSLAKNNDFILVYQKSENLLFNSVEHDDQAFNKKDEFFDERGFYKLNQPLDYDSLQYSPSLDYPIIINEIEYIPGGDINRYRNRKNGQFNRADWAWRWSKKKFEFGIKNGFIELTNGKRPRIYTKTYQKAQINEDNGEYYIDYKSRTKPFSTLGLIENNYSNDRATKDLDKIFHDKKYFDYVKPVTLINFIIKFCSNKNDIILDFFSGSATTAHATMQLNAEDGGNRKFIMVQLPEKLDEKSEAFKDGYRTICDIGEERIRRAGELVKKELIEKNEKVGMLDGGLVDSDKLNIGFKVLKLDKSNIREWNSDFEDIEDNLFAFEDVFVEGRTELDVVYEIMLKNGLELTYYVGQFEVDGKNIYDVAAGILFICLNDDIDNNIAQAIIDKRNDYGIETSTVVFKDSGFKNDSDKLNVIELLKDSGYPEENILTI